MAEEKIITCITCPIGCDITVVGEGDEIISLTGNQCKRGIVYATNEFLHPVRILTTSVKIEGSDEPLIPVRSDKPVPQDMQMDMMAEIKSVVVKAPVNRYDIVIPDIMGTGINIVATANSK